MSLRARGWIAVTVAGCLVAAGCTQAKKPVPAPPPGISWNKAFDAALADARANHRPILLDMYTDWCEWCTALDETTYTDPKFIEFSKRFTMARMNAEVDTATAARYHVMNYPTVLVLNEKGEEMDRVVGYSRAPEFISQIEDYLAGRNTLASVVAQEPAKKNDPEFVFQLADRLADHGLVDESRKRFLALVAMDPRNKTGHVDDAYYRLARMARKAHDYAADRKYAQIILTRYPDSDMMRPAYLEVGQGYRKDGQLAKARTIFLNYAKRFPDDGDAPWAREQADSLGVQLSTRHGA
jgi:thiol-disulfide isomerase/thioredoxin